MRAFADGKGAVLLVRAVRDVDDTSTMSVDLLQGRAVL